MSKSFTLIHFYTFYLTLIKLPSSLDLQPRVTLGVIISRFHKISLEHWDFGSTSASLCDNILASLPGTKSNFPGRRHWRSFQL
jgi:hypothetical protein